MKPFIYVKLDHNNNILEEEHGFTGKFINDEIYYENDDVMIIQKGVILNSRDIINRYKSITNYIVENINNENYSFFNDYRGNFCGVIIEKKKSLAIAYTDHFGSEPLYYYKLPEGEMIISSSVIEICRRTDNANIILNKEGAYELLTYAYMLEDHTLFKGIHRIIPGSCIRIENSSVNCNFYHVIDNTEHEIDETDALRKIDELFLKAVDLQAKKNKEYGYQNFTPISAGLDSRMTCYALKRLGYSDVITFTYSQIGELDFSIPSQIAASLGYNWIFKSLDNGLDLMDINESIELADCCIYYPWPSQLNGFLKMIEKKNMGVVNTGVIGDVVIGSFYRDTSKRFYQLGDGAYSTKLLGKLMAMSSIENNQDYEIGMIYNRGLNGANMGYLTSFIQYGQACSPFMNVDLFDFCMTIPKKMRVGHKLYYKWVLEYYPDAAKFSHNGLRIRKSRRYVKIKGKEYPVNGIIDRAVTVGKNRIGITKGMNPLDDWYNNNSELKQSLDNYFLNSLDHIEDMELQKDTAYLYNNGNALEKTLCISLAGSLKAIKKEK